MLKESKLIKEKKIHSSSDDVSVYIEKISGIRLKVTDPEQQKEIDEMWRKEEQAKKEKEASLKADMKKWTEMALPELTKWNQEFIKNYAPGTANAKRIAPLLNFFPKSIFQKMKDSSPEEKYKWFYENEFKNKLTLKIPGQTGRLNFGWEPGIVDEHGAQGYFMGGESFPGKWLTKLDPNFWFTTTSTLRKWLLFHELEHAVSEVIGKHQSFNIVREEKNKISDLWSQYEGSKVSNVTEQLIHYQKVFSLLNLPEWAKKLMDEGKAESPPRTLQSILPFNWAWANKRDEQRSMLKTFLAKHGGVMTPEVLNSLCEARERAGRFNWKEASLEQKKAFVEAFEIENSIRLNLLLYLNCANKDVVLNHINSIVKDTSQEEQRVVSASVDNKLTILHKALSSQGFNKEAEEVKLLIK